MSGYANACKRIADKYFPEFTEKQKIEFYWGATAFPFASPKYLHKQVSSKARATSNIQNPKERLNTCLAIADEETYSAMRAAKKES